MPAFLCGMAGFDADFSHPIPPQATMKTVEVRHPLVQHKIGLLRNALSLIHI